MSTERALLDLTDIVDEVNKLHLPEEADVATKLRATAHVLDYKVIKAIRAYDEETSNIYN